MTLPNELGAGRILSAGRHQALMLLVDAYETALELGEPAKEFALQLSRFIDHGLTDTTIRWLLHQGFAEHLRETTKPRQQRRVFRKVPNGRFGLSSCLVLCAAHVSTARRFAAREVGSNGKSAGPEHRPIPYYDASRRALVLDGTTIKEFRVPAHSQELILRCFQEEKWPYRIDDPLPPQFDQDPKRRLHDAIDRLNRNQKQRLIRFRGDGTGRGVCWECPRQQR